MRNDRPRNVYARGIFPLAFQVVSRYKHVELH